MGWFIAKDGSSQEVSEDERVSNEATVRELMVKSGSED